MEGGGSGRGLKMEDGNCEVVVCDVLVCIILDEVHVY